MTIIELPQISTTEISLCDIATRGLDIVNAQYLPDIANEDNCDSLSTAIVNKHNNEVLGLILVSQINVGRFKAEEKVSLIKGCGIAKGLDNVLTEFIVNKLISHMESLFRVGRNDDGAIAIDYICLQPISQEECEELMSDYGLVRHNYNNNTMLSMRNNGTSINLGFLKRYFK